MGEPERRKLIQEIETIRGRRLITYVTTLRPNVMAMLEPIDMRVLRSHLDRLPSGKTVDLFLVTFGGVSTVPWAMANLIKATHSGYSVLVPFFAASAGTSLALGANEIVMGPSAMLSPVDPQVGNEFNPEVRGQPVPISVEDIAGFHRLLTEKFGIKDERNLSALIDRLPADVRPLALGNAYRHYVKSREDTRRLLELHMDPEKDKAIVDRISETLTEKLYFHGHHIPRAEARELGLNVSNAEDFHASGGRSLAEVMWDLFKDYEATMKFMQPYTDEPPDTKPGKISKIEIPAKFMESADSSSVFVIEQSWRKYPLPADAIPTQIQTPQGTAPAVFIPPQTLIPLGLLGGPVIWSDSGLYSKTEVNRWKGI